METYTWSEWQLTLEATGVAPQTTGVPKPSGTELPELPCMVTVGPGSNFVSTAFPGTLLLPPMVLGSNLFLANP